MTDPPSLGNDVTHSGQVFPPQLMQSRKSPTGTPINQTNLTKLTKLTNLTKLTVPPEVLLLGDSKLCNTDRAILGPIRVTGPFEKFTEVETTTFHLCTCPSIISEHSWPLGSRTVLKARCTCKPHNIGSAMQLLAHALLQINKRLPAV